MLVHVTNDMHTLSVFLRYSVTVEIGPHPHLFQPGDVEWANV